jgi:hypothetical protein
MGKQVSQAALPHTVMIIFDAVWRASEDLLR